MNNSHRTAIITTAAGALAALLLTPAPATAQLPKDPAERAKVIAQIMAANARQLGGVFEALSLWALFPSLWRGWRGSRALIGRTRLVLVLPATLVACSLALLIGNYGTIVRQRLQVTVFLVPFAALGWSLRRHAGPSAISVPSVSTGPSAVHREEVPLVQ